MHYSNIKYYDIADGSGVRTSLFVSGCRHHCKGCFNEIAWDFEHGDEFTKEVEDKIIESVKAEYISGLTLLGGEPMEPENQKALYPFISRFKRETKKSIWCYSGYTYEQLLDANEICHTDITKDILNLIDVLVDGRYIEELKDISLKFRGSSNQRLIDMKETIKNGTIVLMS